MQIHLRCAWKQSICLHSPSRLTVATRLREVTLECGELRKKADAFDALRDPDNTE